MASTPVCGAPVMAVHLMAKPTGEPGRAEHFISCCTAVSLKHFVVADQPPPAVAPSGICGTEPKDAVLLTAKVDAMKIGVTALEFLNHLTGGHITDSLFSGEIGIHCVALLSQTIRS